MAVELGPHQIRVNSIQPTLVTDTIMGQESIKVIPKVIEGLKERSPLRRFPQVEHVVNLALYLLSDASDMVNGAFIPVDGGILCT